MTVTLWWVAGGSRKWHATFEWPGRARDALTTAGGTPALRLLILPFRIMRILLAVLEHLVLRLFLLLHVFLLGLLLLLLSFLRGAILGGGGILGPRSGWKAQA